MRPSAYRYKPEQVAAALQACAAEVGRSPRSAEYGRWRQQQNAASDGVMVAYPSYAPAGRPMRARGRRRRLAPSARFASRPTSTARSPRRA